MVYSMIIKNKGGNLKFVVAKSYKRKGFLLNMKMCECLFVFLKEPSGQIISTWKWYHWIDLGVMNDLYAG